MNIQIAAIGRMKAGPERDLVESYLKRLPWSVDLREIDDRKTATLPDGQNKEADALLAAVPDGAYIISLDENGRNLDSRALSKRLSDLAADGYNPVTFLIGGARGHGDAVKQRADLTLSFGSLTWPHMLVRVMLAEQLYRAWSISAGHPYHRD